MMKLVDMRDLGSRAAMRWGSSPHTRTITGPIIDTMYRLSVRYFYAGNRRHTKTFSFGNAPIHLLTSKAGNSLLSLDF